MKRLSVCFALFFVLLLKTNTSGFAQNTYAKAIFAQVGSDILPYLTSLPVNECIQLADKGYLIGEGYGFMKSYFLIKTDSAGNPAWVKKYNSGTTSSYPFAYLCALPDTGYIVYTNVSGYPCIQRHDKFGNTLWNKKYNSSASFPASGAGKVFFYAPGVIQINYATNDSLNINGNAVMRLDLATGNLISNTFIRFPDQPSFDHNFQDAVMDAQHNTFVLTKHILGYVSVLYKLDSALQVVTAVALTDSPAYLHLRKMAFLPDGNLLLAGQGCWGFTQGNCSYNSQSLRVIKITPSGQLLFSKKFDQVSDLPDETEIGVKSDGSILIYNTCKNPLLDPSDYIRMMHLDSGGNLISSNQFVGEGLGGLFMNNDLPTIFFKLSVWFNFIANCHVQMQTDSTGMPPPGCSLIVTSPITTGYADTMTHVIPYQLQFSPDNRLTSPFTDIVVPGLTPTTVNYCILNDNNASYLSPVMELRAIPNPSDKEITVSTGTKLSNGSCSITDVLGNQVRLIQGIHADSFVIEKGNLLPGIYLLHIIDDGISGTAKICFTE